MNFESLGSKSQEIKSTYNDIEHIKDVHTDRPSDISKSLDSLDKPLKFDVEKVENITNDPLSSLDKPLNETETDSGKIFDLSDVQNETENTTSENVDRTEKPDKKGGSYGEVYKEGEGDTHEVHHMPADSASNLERNDGPAIKMEKEDHRQTASCGNSKEAREYRAKQKELIEQGKFREALQMDIDDIHDKFGDKYDDAIAEMLEYVDQLEAEGKING